MGTIRQTNTIAGTLDGIEHNVTGTSSLEIKGYQQDSFNITTAYTEIKYPTGANRQCVLIYNEGADEVFVRVQPTSGSLFNYCMIPPGAPMEILTGPEETGVVSGIYRIDIKANTSTARVIVHQVWI